MTCLNDLYVCKYSISWKSSVKTIKYPIFLIKDIETKLDGAERAKGHSGRAYVKDDV